MPGDPQGICPHCEAHRVGAFIQQTVNVAKRDMAPEHVAIDAAGPAPCASALKGDAVGRAAAPTRILRRDIARGMRVFVPIDVVCRRVTDRPAAAARRW